MDWDGLVMYLCGFGVAAYAGWEGWRCWKSKQRTAAAGALLLAALSLALPFVLSATRE